MTVYSYAWDHDDGLGCCVFKTADERDKALCLALLSWSQSDRICFEDDKWPDFEKLCEDGNWSGALTLAEDECLEIEGAHYVRDEHELA